MHSAGRDLFAFEIPEFSILHFKLFCIFYFFCFVCIIFIFYYTMLPYNFATHHGATSTRDRQLQWAMCFALSLWYGDNVEVGGKWSLICNGRSISHCGGIAVTCDFCHRGVDCGGWWRDRCGECGWLQLRIQAGGTMKVRIVRNEGHGNSGGLSYKGWA